MAPTKSEMESEVSETFDRDYSGQTYAEGVRAALDWVLGNTDESPMSE